ncbi:MAG: hypothetical protein JXO72_10575 [Vicinamibacteria bacterium]|nr:hypothetical protein [Vicinamibacteria bacterium]
MSRWRSAFVAGSGMICFIMAIVWLGQERPRDKQTFPAGSAHSLAPEGCALAYRYLKATVRHPAAVRILSQPLGWQEPAFDAVVFRVRPMLSRRRPEEVVVETESPKCTKPHRAVHSLLSTDDEGWVRRGGRLVVAMAREHDGIVMHTPPTDAVVEKVFPIWPGVALVKPPVRRVFESAPAAAGYALFTIGSRAFLWRQSMGAGEVILLSMPEVIENHALADADHLALLASLAGEGRDVYFDENTHGVEHREGLLVMLLRWGCGPSLVLFGLMFAATLWRYRTPIGASEDIPPPRRSEAIDLVDSMAQLYDRVLSRREALERYARCFERAVAGRTGLRERALTARVRAFGGDATTLAAGDKEIGADEFMRGLARINSAFRRLEEHARTRRNR